MHMRAVEIFSAPCISAIAPALLFIRCALALRGSGPPASTPTDHVCCMGTVSARDAASTPGKYFRCLQHPLAERRLCGVRHRHAAHVAGDEYDGIDIESETHRLHVPETADKQSGADEKYDGEGTLNDYEQASGTRSLIGSFPRPGKGQRAPVGEHRKCRIPGQEEGAQKLSSPRRNAHTRRATDHAKHQAFGEELREEARSAHSDGKAHRDLPPTPQGVGE